MPPTSGRHRAGCRARRAQFWKPPPNPIVAIDSAAHISYLNPQDEAVFGYMRDELLGQPIEILLQPSKS
jgi:PAS domain S-box